MITLQLEKHCMFTSVTLNEKGEQTPDFVLNSIITFSFKQQYIYYMGENAKTKTEPEPYWTHK